MQRTPLPKKTSSGQLPWVDRFVAPRDYFEKLRLRTSCSRERTIDIWSAKYIQKKKYSMHLNEAFGIKVMPPQQLLKSKEQFFVKPWPCIPRKKHYLSSAGSILDLPSYSNTPFPDLVDWSSDNILVAAIGRNYHKWSWRTQSHLKSGHSQHVIQCCKFDPRGELLLLGTNIALVEIHDNVSNKLLNAANCGCPRLTEPRCSITALDWSPTGNSFVTGCAVGTISSFTRDAWPIASIRYIRKMVLMVRVSPNARRLAASVKNHPMIFIYTWPELDTNSTIDSPEWTNKVFAWHPWRTALLGIGAMYGDVSHLATWDVNSDTLNEIPLSYNQYEIDTLLFSHRTGEMLLSLWHPDDEPTTRFPKSNSHLVVLSDPETVVDQWGEGRSGVDRIRTMVFNPDGTKLATATADEDLIIWNFLPEDYQSTNNKNKTDSRRLSAMPDFLDKAKYGVSIR